MFDLIFCCINTHFYIECLCDQCGSTDCDNTNGQCNCLPFVDGVNCDRCQVCIYMIEYYPYFSAIHGAFQNVAVVSNVIVQLLHHRHNVIWKLVHALVCLVLLTCVVLNVNMDIGIMDHMDVTVSGYCILNCYY